MDNPIQIIRIIVTFILYMLVKLRNHLTEIMYLYLFGTYNMSAMTGNHFNRMIVQCESIDSIYMYMVECVS